MYMMDPFHLHNFCFNILCIISILVYVLLKGAPYLAFDLFLIYLPNTHFNWEP